MTRQQKRAATALSLAVVAVASGYFTWLAIAVATGVARGDQPPAKLFMLLISSWDALAVELKGLPILISTGLAILGAYRLRDGLFFAIVAVAALGAVSSVYLFLEAGSGSVAYGFWAYFPTEVVHSYEAFKPAAQKVLGPIGAWFIWVIGLELGIKRLATV